MWRRARPVLLALLRTLLRHRAAVLLIVILGLLPVRAFTERDADTVDFGKPADGLESITWTGTVASDGRLSIRIDYVFADDNRHEFDVRVPDGARYLSFNGSALAADLGKYATTSASKRATISYELNGRVKRYRGGAIVQLAGPYDSSSGAVTLDSDAALFTCPSCYIDEIGYGDTPVYGAIVVVSATGARLLFNGLDPAQLRVPIDAPESESARADGRLGQPTEIIAFAGIDRGTSEVSMLAILPEAAVPDLARGDGDVDAAIAAFRNGFSESDDQFQFARPPAGRESLVPTLILALLFAAVVVSITAQWLWRTGTERATRRSSDRRGESTEIPRTVGPTGRPLPPNDLAAALVGLVVGDSASGRTSVVAATILDLARRDVISITGTDERRFSITIPADATGESDFERAVLTQMRPLGTDPNPAKETVLTGPPLWHQRAPIVTRVLYSALVREGLRHNLIHRNRPLLLAAPISIAMGLVALLRVDSVTVHAWVALIVGPLLAVLVARRAGVTLTNLGTQQRDQWLEYAARLNDDTDFARSAPTEIQRLGEPFVYAAAVGAAPVAAAALSPGPRRELPGTARQ